MSSAIGYRTLLRAELVIAITEAWPLLGGVHASGWLEHPLHADGILIRDNDIDCDQAQHLAIAWPIGRLFGTSGELRWECLENQLITDEQTPDGDLPPEQIQLVLTITLPPPVNAADELTQRGYLEVRTLVQAHEERVMLWGRKTSEKGWSVERIPELRYPEAWSGPYAAIITYGYLIEAAPDRPYDSETIRYVRYAGALQLGAAIQ